uniref:Uncharacterized protein n=1 Tax=Medicago truncatula TaxID=3880 RepID=I3T6X0_MEDTR|nr:unknown [Medicago truncatula]
MPNCETFLT